MDVLALDFWMRAATGIRFYGAAPPQELRATMVEMRNGEGADYDAVSFEQFYQWWLVRPVDARRSVAIGLPVDCHAAQPTVAWRLAATQLPPRRRSTDAPRWRQGNKGKTGFFAAVFDRTSAQQGKLQKEMAAAQVGHRSLCSVLWGHGARWVSGARHAMHDG
jgi:hypothetical protein